MEIICLKAKLGRILLLYLVWGELHTLLEGGPTTKKVFHTFFIRLSFF